MKAKSVIKSIFGTVILAGLMCLLPVFSNAVSADTLDPIILLENEEPATQGEHYYIDETYKRIELKTNNLIIKQSKVVDGVSYQLYDAQPTTTDPHCYTLSNLTMNLSGNNNAVALLFNGEGNEANRKLYVDGTCSIELVENIFGYGINMRGGSVEILPKNNSGDKLNIVSGGGGIFMSGDSCDEILVFGDGEKNLEVSINSKKWALNSNSAHKKPLTIKKGVTLECQNGSGLTSDALVDEFSAIYINGKVVLNQWANVDPNNYTGAIKLKGEFTVGPDADILIMSDQKYAVMNVVANKRYEEIPDNGCIMGAINYTDKISEMERAVFPAYDSGTDYSGCARYYPATCSEDDILHSIAIRPFCTVHFDYPGIADSKGMKGCPNYCKPYPYPTDPDGAEFDGWYKDRELTEKWEFSTQVNEDITLYPGFACNVIFESNGGSTVPAQKVIKGKKVNPVANPSKDNYVFAGWYSDNGCTEEYDLEAKVEKNITLYAKWIQKSPDMVTVTFETNGGTGIKPMLIKKGEKASKPKNPEKEGYKFIGWCSDNKCTKKYDFETKLENDITIYAKWEKNSDEPDEPDKPKKTYDLSKLFELYKYLESAEPEDADEEITEVITDYDTFKSECPSGTVTTKSSLEGQTLFDMKVHSAEAKTLSNQELLSQYLVGADTEILLTENIYPRRDLTTDENGFLQILIWNNLPKNQAGPVYAVVYNQTDGAYVINGYLDADGTAVFTGFKMRPASTITICK